MLCVTVKTLDSQNHSFTVPEESTVKEFKEQISPVLNIAVEKQRLIFCGKVLKDDKKLTEYNVNGKVIHVVQSLPPQGSGATSSATTSSSSSTTNSGPRGTHRDAAGFVLGAFTIPQDFLDANQMQNIVQEVVSGMGELGRNATVISRTTEDGPSVDLRISLGQVPLQSEAQLRMNRVQTMFMRANRILDLLEDGNGSGNNSSESSSQTDNDEEFRNRLMEADIGTVIRADSNGSTGPGDPSTTTENSNEASNASLASARERASSPQPAAERYGLDGLAHVAQAALTAAFATATAAARAATSSLSSHGIPDNESLSSLLASSAAAAIGSIEVSENTASDLLGAVTVPLTTSGSTPISMDIEATVIPFDEPVSSTSTQENKPEPPSGSTSSNVGQTSSNTNSEAPESGSIPTSRETSQPSVQTLANLLDEVIRVNNRLEPCLEKCRDLIRNDSHLTGPQLIEAHRLFSKTSQLLHFLSHAYHSLSDLHVNFTSRPPRSPRVRIISSSPTVFQPAIPLQAQINISSSVIPASSSMTSSSSTTASASSTTASASSTTASASSTTASACSTTVSASSTTSSASSTTASASSTTASASSTTASASSTTTTNSQNPPSEARPGARFGQDPHRPTGTFRSASLPRVSSTSSIPSMMRSQNPMFFMEVTPGSITIDSISAAMDASVSPLHLPDEDSDASSRDTPTPPAPTVSQAETRSDTQTSGTQTPTSRTSTTSMPIPPPFSGQSGTLMPSVRHLIPVPLTSMGSVNAFDSALPCHSVWALEPSRRRHNAGGSRTGSLHRNAPSAADGSIQSTSQTIHISPSPNMVGRHEDQMHSLFNTLVSSLHPPPVVNQTMNLFHNSHLRPLNRQRQDISNLSNRDREALRATDRNAFNLPAPLPSVTEPMFFDWITSMRSSTDFPASVTLSEIFISFRDAQLPENNIVGNLLQFICNQITLSDVFDITMGNFEVLNRLREPLLNYVQEKIFPRENTAAQNKAVIDQIISNFDDLLKHFMTTPPAKQTVDYRATLHDFLKYYIYKLKDAFQDSVQESEFGNAICKLCKCIVLEFLYLHDNCIDGGVMTLDPMVTQMMSQMSGRIDTGLKLILACMATRLLVRDIAPEMEANGVGCRIVYKSATSSSRTSAVAKKSKPAERAVSSTVSSTANSSDRSERPPRESILDTLRAAGDPASPLSSFARIFEQSSLRSSGRNSETRAPTSSLTEVVIGSESWHSSLPRDWVPIIARDVQRQRRQAPQSPFSNAYLSGMPSKRRKIMTNGAPALLGHSQTTFSDMLQQAITSANVKPLSSSEEIKQDASQDLPLQTAFSLHMKNAIQERLQRDLDYCSEKFPNAKKYYNTDQM